MFVHVWTLFWVFILFPCVSSQTTQSTPLPFILPLALRSPYLHAWTSRPNVNHSWPMFWNQDVLGWEGMIRIDGHAYQWLGFSSQSLDIANITSTQITPTRTIFTYDAGPAQLTATFLSPIERSDPVKQSMPFSYVSLDVKFTDGLQHRVQIYMDITGEWIIASTHTDDIITWSTDTVGRSFSTFHQIQRNVPQALVETIGDRAEDMIAVFGTQSGPSVSAVVGKAESYRRAFNTSGIASGAPLTPPAKMGNPYPIFAIFQDLGNISAMTSPVVFVIGIYRNPSILLTTTMFTGETQSQNRAPLFAASLSSISDVMDAFLTDFPNAKSRADDVDSFILNAAGNISEPYKDLVSLAARQTMASTELTIANGTDGRWNMSDIKMFMKDVGDSGRINPVEKIYASFPFFLFINSTYAGQLLSPLLEVQDSSTNIQTFAARDLGLSYPQVLQAGRLMMHQQQVEHTSSMLIMVLAHAKISGDGTLISRHYSLLRKWAEYLVTSTMNPPDSSTVDGGIQANSTNLVVKGIIALKAMSEISNAISLTDDASRYSQHSSAFMDQWMMLTQTSSSDRHLPLSLGGDDPSSWALMYNLYADKLLNTSVIDDKIFQNQAHFYQSLLSQSSGGLPLDSSSGAVASVAWSFFIAATISDSTIRNSLISSVHDHFFKIQANDTRPLPVNYNIDSSNDQGAGNANPAIGAIFAPLALGLTLTGSITIPPFTPPTQTTSEKRHSIAGPIAAGVVGGLALLLVVAVGVFCSRRQRNRTEIPCIEAFTARPNIVTYEGLTLVNHRDSASPPQMPQREEASPTLGVPEKMGQALDNSVSTPGNSGEPATIPLAVSGSSHPAGRSGQPGRSHGTGPRSNLVQLSTTVQGLRSEVESLRRFMQQLQIERVEAPPSYTTT